MSSVETGQMSAVETGQMETGQMTSAARTDISLVTTHNVDVSEVSTIPMLMSQKSQLWQCHNVQVADRRSGPKSAKMARNGSRVVARSLESVPPASPGHFLASGTGPAAKNRQNIAQTPDQPPPAAAMLS